MLQIGLDFLQEAGFTQHQYILFRHLDADHPHLHLMVNRIGYDGTVVSDSNDFARAEKILRKLEKKYHLTEVISSKQARERAMTKDELEMMKRTNTPSHKMQMQILIQEVLRSKPKLTTSEFIQALEKKGINVLFNRASTGYVSGISIPMMVLISRVASLEMSLNGRQSETVSTMNKKEIAQQFTKQILEQNSATLTHEQVQAILEEIQRLCLTVQESSRHQISNIRIVNAAMETIQKQARESKPTSGRPNKTIKRNGTQSSSNSKGLDLATLLDGHTHGNLIHADYQPDLDPESALGLTPKRKKGRKRFR